MHTRLKAQLLYPTLNCCRSGFPSSGSPCPCCGKLTCKAASRAGSAKYNQLANRLQQASWRISVKAAVSAMACTSWYYCRQPDFVVQVNGPGLHEGGGSGFVYSADYSGIFTPGGIQAGAESGCTVSDRMVHVKDCELLLLTLYIPIYCSLQCASIQTGFFPKWSDPVCCCISGIIADCYIFGNIQLLFDHRSPLILSTSHFARIGSITVGASQRKCTIFLNIALALL